MFRKIALIALMCSAAGSFFACKTAQKKDKQSSTVIFGIGNKDFTLEKARGKSTLGQLAELNFSKMPPNTEKLLKELQSVSLQVSFKTIKDVNQLLSNPTNDESFFNSVNISPAVSPLAIDNAEMTNTVAQILNFGVESYTVEKFRSLRLEWELYDRMKSELEFNAKKSWQSGQYLTFGQAFWRLIDLPSISGNDAVLYKISLVGGKSATIFIYKIETKKDPFGDPVILSRYQDTRQTFINIDYPDSSSDSSHPANTLVILNADGQLVPREAIESSSPGALSQTYDNMESLINAVRQNSVVFNANSTVASKHLDVPYNYLYIGPSAND